MNHEMPQHLENEINDWYEGNLKGRLQKAFNEVQCLGGKTVPTLDEVKEVVNRANEIIEEASNGDEELYDYYRYRVFYQDQKYTIIWGQEVNLDE